MRVPLTCRRSFLDSSHTDLIRWSDDGRSFIVLDEDEFARTLIPELFKHNNYASFVRQLNMYGFHKTVNITDGSLRQSEQARTGVKPPSMYSHPYFRKNRPDLLWLIVKPVSAKSTKRKRDGTIKDGYDSDEGSPGPEMGGLPQQISTSGTSQDLAHLPRNELVAVRRELQNLQTQQKFISQMITQLQEQNDQFYRQATAFQNLHDRHEKSINAILTFLATFYNNSLEGGSAQNLVNMFTKAMPHAQRGSVLEEYNDPATPTADNQVQRFVKKTPLLLPGPASSTQNLQPGSAVTEPNSARGSATPPNETSNRGSLSNAPPDNARLSNASVASPAVKTDAPTPNYLQQVPESTDDMMNLINNVNASTNHPNTLPATSAVDMSSLVDRINQNNSPLTPQQREDMVANFASTSSSSAHANNSAASALTNTSTNPAAFTDSIGQSRSTLDYLQQLQKQQDARVQELNRRLVPLSPTGTIPGLAEYGSEQNPFDTYNPGDFINFDDPAPWEHGNGDALAGDGGDFDFNFDGNGGDWGDLEDNGDIFDSVLPGLKEYEGAVVDNNGTGNATADRGGDDADAGRVESVSSAAASPLVRNLADEPEPENEIGTPKKRARRS